MKSGASENRLKQLLHFAREYLTHWAIAGTVITLTGFAPEHWVADLLSHFGIPEGLRRGWLEGFDIRIGLVAIGVTIILIDVLRRRHLQIQEAHLHDPQDRLELARTPDQGSRDEKWAQATEATPLALPDKPSIAVLPLFNMSDDPEQEFFSDGITEDIITGLSRSPWLFVISRSSSFTYKGAAIDVKKVCRELGVRYVLEGSVRKAGDNVRVAAQLIDGTTGSNVFAERYDGNLDEIFRLQDEITQKVVAAITTQILSKTDWSNRRLGRPDIGTWELVMHGQKLWYELTKESVTSAVEVFRRAVTSGPESCDAHYGLAATLFHAVYMGFVEDSDASIAEAYDLAKRALVLDDGNEYAHWTAGLIELWRRRHDAAVAQFEQAINLNPNCSVAYGSLGNTLAYSHKPDESIKNNEVAIRTNPKDPSIFFRFSGMAVAHYVAGRYEDAVNWAQRAVNRKPDWYMGHLVLAASLGQLNRLKEARGAIDGLLQVVPGATVLIAERLPFQYIEDTEHLRIGLRKAGLPE